MVHYLLVAFLSLLPDHLPHLPCLLADNVPAVPCYHLSLSQALRFAESTDYHALQNNCIAFSDFAVRVLTGGVVRNAPIIFDAVVGQVRACMHACMCVRQACLRAHACVVVGELRE